jgi:hypothetical protein
VRHAQIRPSFQQPPLPPPLPILYSEVKDEEEDDDSVEDGIDNYRNDNLPLFEGNVTPPSAEEADRMYDQLMETGPPPANGDKDRKMYKSIMEETRVEKTATVEAAVRLIRSHKLVVQPRVQLQPQPEQVQQMVQREEEKCIYRNICFLSPKRQDLFDAYAAPVEEVEEEVAAQQQKVEQYVDPMVVMNAMWDKLTGTAAAAKKEVNAKSEEKEQRLVKTMVERSFLHLNGLTPLFINEKEKKEGNPGKHTNGKDLLTREDGRLLENG